MSDAPQGPGWWLASDGKWYPPQPPATPQAPHVSPSPQAHQPYPAPPGAQTKRSSGRNLLIGFGACGALLVIALLIGALGSTANKTTNATGTTSSTADAATATTEPAPASERDDATSTTAEEPTTTATPAPTTTVRTAAPDEFYSGSGDGVQNLTATVVDPRIATISYQGTSNFVVKSLEVGGGESLLVNTIGSYTGTVSVGFEAGTAIEAFEVNASGPWTITLKDITSAPVLSTNAGSRFDGAGDNVILYRPLTRSTLAIACPGCSSNFAVKAWGDRSDLLVNEIGTYSGSVSAPSDTVLLEITASSSYDSAVAPSWSITVP